eukprot:7324372-Pyramimonas_sp.AAC.1
MASRRPPKLPRRPKRLPRCAPRGPLETNIVPFPANNKHISHARLIGFHNVHSGHKKPGVPPPDGQKGP